MYGLVDCNNFYASCERVFRPDLNTKPVIVLSNNDGCVIARSNETKAMGIPMGAPSFKYKDVFERNKVNIFSSNFALYGDLSKRVMSIIKTMAPRIQIYSIDEAFLEFKGCEYLNLEEHGKAIRKKILKNTGIPVSIGFAPTKTLSKVANHIAKKYSEQTGGVYVIDTEEKIEKALKWLPIEDVWGIGKQHSKKLKNTGIHKAYDFVKTHDQWIQNQFSIVGLRLKKELEGKSIHGLKKQESKKSIATTRTFEKEYSNYEDVRERVVSFAINCAEKLRKQHSKCKSIMIFINTNRFKSEQTQYNKSIVIDLPYPTNSSIEISKFAISGLEKIFKNSYPYKKAGVVAMNIIPTDKIQLNIFENSNPKHENLMKTIDFLNLKIGNQKIKLASQDLKKTWKMKQEKLSPRYSTDLNEIIEVF